MNANLILWIYVGLLIAGGLIGYFKAKSTVSLIMSSAFAVLLGLCAAGLIRVPYLVHALLLLLLVVFVIRLSKTRRMMPAGGLAALTLVTLLLYHFLR